jgi:hypothetical protein
MRRVFASLLLVVYWFGFALLFVQAQPGAIPACCRREGKHHCAMSLDRDGFRAAASNCPWRHFGVLTSRVTALKTASSVLIINIHGQFGNRITTPKIALPTLDNTQKRGPPLA